MALQTEIAPRVCVLPDDAQATIVLDRCHVRAMVRRRLDADAVPALAADVDLVHLHLGLPATPHIPAPRAVAAALVAHELPLVVTAHDLSAATTSLLDALSPAVTRLLVPQGRLGVAVHGRPGRPTIPVRPSPADAPADAITRHDGGLVGMYDADHPLLAATTIPSGDRGPALRVVRRSGRVAHPRDLASWVAGLSVLVLAPGTPARGTWVELCRELGVASVVPTHPLEVDARATTTYVATAGPGVVARAARHASRVRPVARSSPGQRARLVGRLRSVHTDLYRRLAAVVIDLE